MKKLTDVYIKVTKSNVEELRIIIQPNLDVDDIVAFNSDCLNSFFYGISIGNRKKVSLTELKRLIDTIPTREEIIRLKQQISGYKMNYDKAVKHSLSKEDELEFLRGELNRLKEDDYKIVGFQTNLSLTIERCKELQSDNERLFHENDNLKDKLSLQKVLNDKLKQENEQLKPRKWYKFWK